MFTNMVRNKDPYFRPKPFQSNQERLVDEALYANTRGSEEIKNIRPPIPRIGLLPPRFGYSHGPIGIRDIVNLDVLFPGARIDYSQSVSGYSSSSYPSQAIW